MKTVGSYGVFVPESRMRHRVRRGISLSAILATVVVLSGKAALAPDDSPSLIRNVDDSTRLEHDFRTEYEVLTFPPVPLAEAEAVEFTPDDASYRDRIRVIAHGEKLRQDLERITPGRVPYVITHIWDGEQLWIIYPDENVVEVHAAGGALSPPRSVDLHSQGHVFNRIKSRYRGDWAARIAQDADTVSCETDGELLTCRTEQASTAEFVNAMFMEFLIHQPPEEAPKLMSLEQRFQSRHTRRDLLEERYLLATTWRVQSWETHGRIEMPAAAEFISTQVANFERPDDGPVMQSRTLYRRLAFEELDDDTHDSGLFEVPLVAGTRLIDADLKFSFRIGERYLAYDGTLYLLDEPLMEHPGERLPELIRTATPQGPLPNAPAPRGHSHEPLGDSASRSRYSGLSMLGIALGAGALAFVLVRSARKLRA